MRQSEIFAYAMVSMGGSNVAGILLAAGVGRRMGATNKLLRQWRGKPLLTHALETMLALQQDGDLQQMIVVLGRDAEAVAALLPDKTVMTVRNPDYQSGIASSLRAGLSVVSVTSEAALIFLADMPRVSVADVRMIIQAFHQSRASIVVPQHCGQRGNPVLLGRDQFIPAQALHGDSGARQLMTVIPPQSVETGAGVLYDIDTPAQLF